MMPLLLFAYKREPSIPELHMLTKATIAYRRDANSARLALPRLHSPDILSS